MDEVSLQSAKGAPPIQTWEPTTLPNFGLVSARTGAGAAEAVDMVGDGSGTNTTADSVEESDKESKSKACRAWERRVPGDGRVSGELLDMQTEEGVPKRLHSRCSSRGYNGCNKGTKQPTGQTDHLQPKGIQTEERNGSSTRSHTRIAAVEATTGVQQ